VERQKKLRFLRKNGWLHKQHFCAAFFAQLFFRRVGWLHNLRLSAAFFAQLFYRKSEWLHRFILRSFFCAKAQNENSSAEEIFSVF
jgi:hypothetical protein